MTFDRNKPSTEMNTAQDGYREAEFIDELIGRLFVSHPITADSIRAWMIFVRTLDATLVLLNTQISKTLNVMEYPTREDLEIRDAEDEGSHGKH